MFSVLMSIYKGEKVNNFVEAFESVIKQTLKPSEIILIRDGQVYEELQNKIDEYLKSYGEIITYIPLDENKGLGNALSVGVSAAKNELIARMDTDDIAKPNRFEIQYNFMQNNPDIDIVGSHINEFIGDESNIICQRKVPLTNQEICKELKSFNPFNHMTVMFRKESVLKAGNYLDLYYLEDYYLWCRMYLAGAKFANIDEVLVDARVGNDMVRRRGGYKYFCSYKKLKKFMLKNKMISFANYIFILFCRFNIQVLFPNKLRGFIIRKFTRKKV